MSLARVAIKVAIKMSANCAGILLLALCVLTVMAQDVQRQTVAIAYPLDETITVKFTGTTLLPRLKGEAKVRRTNRRGTRVELSIDNMPRASELGGIYTTYVVWAISPEGQVDNLGEIKRSGNSIIDSKIDVTTPLQTFALIVTAEPHFLMKVPSRMVIMENLPPRYPGGAQIETAATISRTPECPISPIAIIATLPYRCSARGSRLTSPVLRAPMMMLPPN
jgi:hypothetical protein